MPAAAMILYKYCSPRGVDILESLRIKVTPPIEFNDPFEFTPQIVGTIPLQHIERMLTDPAFLSHAYPVHMAAGTFSGSKTEFDHYMREQKTSQSQEFLKGGLPIVVKVLRTIHLVNLSKDIGLLCLSEKDKDILMWSHYSDGHTGLVVGLTTDHPPLSVTERLWKVAYDSERVKLDLAWLPDSEEYKQYTKELVTTKSSHWQYEQEWRQFFPLQKCHVDRHDDATHYFLKIQPQLITKVILGWRCSDVTENSVRRALTESRLQHVLLEKTVLDERKFELETVKV
jgi:hypothetical protein